MVCHMNTPQSHTRCAHPPSTGELRRHPDAARTEVERAVQISTGAEVKVTDGLGGK